MEAKHRPIGVTILAIVAGFMAVWAILLTLRWLGLVPWFGPGPAIRVFSIWYALLYGLLAWVYIWLTKMLWEVDPTAWLFLAVITVFNLVLNFITLIVNEFGNTDTLVVSIIINALVLIYIMLPGVKEAFGTTQ
jgi:hypothetical protein